MAAMDLEETAELTLSYLTRNDLREELEAFATGIIRNELKAFASQLKRELCDELPLVIPGAPVSRQVTPNGGAHKPTPISPGGTSVGAISGQTMGTTQVESPTSPGKASATGFVGPYTEDTALTSVPHVPRYSSEGQMPTYGSEGGISRFDDDEDGFGVGMRGYVVTAEMDFLQEQETKRNSFTGGYGKDSKDLKQFGAFRKSVRLRRATTMEPLPQLPGPRKARVVRRSSEDGDMRPMMGHTATQESDRPSIGMMVTRTLSVPARATHLRHWETPSPPSTRLSLERPEPPDEADLASLPGVSHAQSDSTVSVDFIKQTSTDSAEPPSGMGMVNVPNSDASEPALGGKPIHILANLRPSLASDSSILTSGSHGSWAMPMDSDAGRAPRASKEEHARSTTTHSVPYESIADHAHRATTVTQCTAAERSTTFAANCMVSEKHRQVERYFTNDIDEEEETELSETMGTSKSMIQRISRRYKRSLLYRIAAKLLNHPLFDYITTLLIVLNAITIGVQADWAARNVKEVVPNAFGILESIFCICFTVELVVRIFVHRSKFFTMATWKWNVFDTVVVSVQIIEESFALVWKVHLDNRDNGLPTNIAALRVMRILRVIRIVRLVRVLRLINELRTLVHSIVGTLKSLMWTCVLIFLMIYIIGVYLTQVVTDARVDLQDYGEDLKIQNAFSLYYGTLAQSILSLYQSISGGIDWADMVTPLTDHIHPLLGLFFAAYIAFTLLAVFNVVTGVFVETALVSAKEDKDVYMVNHLRNIFMSSDQNDDGTIDWREFESQLRNKELKEYFKAIDVDISEARAIFRLLDQTDTGNIDAKEFLSGCLRLKGPAKSLDMNILLRETRRMSQMYKAHAHWVERHISQMKEVVPAVRQICTIMNMQSTQNVKEEWLV